MKMNLIKGLMIFSIVLIASLPAAAQRILGGYKAAATDEARVVAAAEFAVADRVENNTEQEGLELDSIDKAEVQSVAGMNFRLCLTVSLDGNTQQVEALVYQDLKQNYTLKSWTPKDCAPQTDEEAMTKYQRLVGDWDSIIDAVGGK